MACKEKDRFVNFIVCQQFSECASVLQILRVTAALKLVFLMLLEVTFAARFESDIK